MTKRPPAPTPESRPVVLITWPDFDVALPGGRTDLERAGLEVRYAPRLRERSPDELTDLLWGAVAAIVSTDPFTAEVLAASPQLQVIARVGVGFDSIDVDEANRVGVMVTTTSGANETTVADHTLALMLAATRRITEHDRNVKAGKWLRTGDQMSWLLTGATVGLVGYGAIGRLVAQRLRGFDTRILVSDPAFHGDGHVEAVSLEDLLVRSDIVSLHAPLLPSTRGLIGTREIGLMKRTAMMINTGRGGIVSETALAVALREHRIRYAGIDVFDREPPGSSDLLALDNAVLTPHVAGVSEASVAEMVERAAMSVLDTVSGRVPRNVVNPQAVPAWESRRKTSNA
ncbi:phosphoglycerate dehydrogenase [Microbacterium sp. 179-I 3D2 NHS]|uniref:phosphoglycerate dehydrogenase n=1 Tax=Microbacterium sp. 179-I 3D2 NHS TaxID=3235178 RepID=UPI0039A2010F